nr:hypothetical protein [Bacillus taeanensis]
MKPAVPSLQLTKPVPFSQRQYLTLAIPLIISGISTPLLGAVDTAVVGRIPDPASIGSVAVGGDFFWCSRSALDSRFDCFSTNRLFTDHVAVRTKL